MAKQISINTDKRRLALLQQSQTMGRRDQATGLNYLSPATLDAIDAFLPGYQAAYDEATEEAQAYSDGVAAADGAVSTLCSELRSVWSLVDARIQTRKLAGTVYTYYGLSLTGARPVPSNRDAWLEAGTAVVAGHDRALADGIDLNIGEEITSLTEAVAAARHAVRALPEAKREKTDARLAMTPIQTDAQDLCNQILAELRLAFHRYPAATRRELMRSYGVEYKAEAAPAPAPDPAPAA